MNDNITIICSHCEGRLFSKIKHCKEGKLQCKYCHKVVTPSEKMFTKNSVLNLFKQLYIKNEEDNNV